MSRKISLFLLVSLVTMLLAACGGNAAPAAAPTTAAAEAPTAAAPAATKPPAPTITPVPAIAQPAGSTKITFWYGLTGANGNVVRTMVNQYNSSQSKYYVEA